MLVWLLACSAMAADVQRLVDMARAAPPELGADVLIRLSASPKVRARGEKREMLREAFAIARGAKFDHAWRASGHGDDAALALGLSRSGLQARAVRRMVAVDPPDAVRLMGLMAKPDVAAIECSAALVPVVVEYFQALREVTRRAFLDSERRRGLDFVLVRAAVGSMRSARELEPVAQLIHEGAWSREQLDSLVGDYARLMADMDSDGLLFAAGFGLQKQVAELIPKLVRAGLSPRELSIAWRSFLVRRLGGERCGGDEVLRRMMAAYNDVFRRMADAPPELTPQDDKPSRVSIRPAPRGIEDAAPVTVSALKESPLLRANPPEWRSLLSRLIEVKNGRAEVLEAMRTSGNPVMEMYAELEMLDEEAKQ